MGEKLLERKRRSVYSEIAIRNGGGFLNMTFKELREKSGMNQTKFAEYFGIPRRTVQNWELGLRTCPDYLLNLMKYKLEKENILKG